MTWSVLHSESERLAQQAQLALRNGDPERARVLYAEAARAESQALAELDPRKTRTLGVTAVSAVSLWYKAEEYARAENSFMSCRSATCQTSPTNSSRCYCNPSGTKPPRGRLG